MAQFKADVDILTSNDSGTRAAPAPLFAIHTFEGNPNITADDMARYQLSPAAGGSYNGVIDRTGRTARENDDHYIPWAAMPTGNRLARHWSLAGRAAQSRAEWLAQPRQLDALAHVLAHDHREYGTPLKLLTVSEVARSRTDSSMRGVCGHVHISQAFGESDHTDPGGNFPYDYVISRAAEIVRGETSPPTQEADTMTPEDRKILIETRDTNREILRQLGMPGGHPQGGKRTLYDLTSAIAEIEGVPGTRDTLA